MLINYVHGFDVYDELSSGNTNTADGSIKKRQWLMGDVLHSKPLVLSYATFSYPDEGNCGINKNMIYVGTNDGMLHAFNDCDGSEAWAFIPPELLPYLQYLRSSNHAYFVDSSIQAYKFDKDPNDGAIASSKHDSVVLVVGLRRGGGVTTEPGKGFYYILDVTDPTSPKLLSRFSNSTTGFTDLGESWSEPKIGKVVVGSNKKLAAFIGGGYDNCNEDARFGATQSYPGTCINAIASADGGLDSSNLPITSSGTVAASSFTSSASYKGRGVYAVELATFPSSTSTSGLDFSNTGSLIWSYTFNTGATLPYSMLSEIAALDFNGDGYVDRLYMGDAGGNVWRFDLSATSPTDWTVTKIFSSNPGSTGYPTSAVNNADIGRKIFYRPAVSPDRGMVWLFFGTGDREHPLNRAVQDRIYGLTDKGQTSAVTEAKLLDVTTDPIQTALTQSDLDAAKAKLDLVSSPTDTAYYGWYIRLDGGDRSPAVNNPGEKVLATAAVAAGNVFVTTYSPSTGATDTTSTSPCQLGNLGNGTLYVLNYLSGAAVVNYDPNNDPTSSTYNFNKYAFATGDTGKAHVLLRTDRKRTIGKGIPSSAVVICDPGDAACKWLVGCGGGICSDSGPGMDTNLVTPVYWRQK
jgi:type IV pilus assembly protein PilY1